jgi:hypothetical protein
MVLGFQAESEASNQLEIKSETSNQLELEAATDVATISYLTSNVE